MMNMTGMDRDIFRATRRLTTLLNEACNHWNYLCPYLEKLGGAANMALEGYQKDYPKAVAAIIAQDRKSAIRPLRNCDRFADETDAQIAFLNEVWLISVTKETALERDGIENWTDEMRSRYAKWLFAPATEQKGENNGSK